MTTDRNADLPDLVVNLQRAQEAPAPVGGTGKTAYLGTSEVLPLVESTSLATDNFSLADTYRWLALPPGKGAGGYVSHEKLALAESNAVNSHAKNNYKWGDADAKWGFASWA